jgi:hypothetical protein
VVLDDEQRPFATGVSVRSTVETDRGGSPLDPWKEGATFDPISSRVLQRLPLAVFRNAAVAGVRDLIEADGGDRMRRTIQRERLTQPEFDRRLLARVEKLTREGVRGPAAQIAREEGTEPGTVRVWIHRAKKRQEEQSSNQARTGRRPRKGKR